jgi:hypothetical protein
MEEHKHNCIELYYHRGRFRYFCGDTVMSACKYFDLSETACDCRYAGEHVSIETHHHVCKNKAAQKDAKVEICDSLECETTEMVRQAAVHFEHSLSSVCSWTKEDVEALVNDDMGIKYPNVTTIVKDRRIVSTE